MKLKSISALSCGLLFAAIALQPAQAQSKPDKVVTRDELRVCMNTESDLAARRKALDLRNKQNGEEAAAIRAEAQELSEEQKRVEGDSSREERFMNRRVKPHNARVQAANAKVDEFRKDALTLNEALIAYNEKCGGISFSKEDKEAILKERESATK